MIKWWRISKLEGRPRTKEGLESDIPAVMIRANTAHEARQMASTYSGYEPGKVEVQEYAEGTSPKPGDLLVTRVKDGAGIEITAAGESDSGRPEGKDDAGKRKPVARKGGRKKQEVAGRGKNHKPRVLSTHEGSTAEDPARSHPGGKRPSHADRARRREVRGPSVAPVSAANEGVRE